MKKLLMQVACTLFPQRIANLAYRQLMSPQVHKLRPHEAEFLKTAEQKSRSFHNFTIQTYEWGQSNPTRILLIHGWEGQAGNFTDLVPKLLEKDFHVIAFDAPSHGFSSKGSTSLFEFSDLVGELARSYQCTYLISHSFGGVATTFGLYKNQDLAIKRYALLTTPDSFAERIDSVAAMVGITDKVKHLLIERLEREYPDLGVRTIAVSNLVPSIQVEKALIIHDKNDQVIPIHQSQNVCNNWDTCSFKMIEGTGHFRILRTDWVLDEVVNFVLS